MIGVSVMKELKYSQNTTLASTLEKNTKNEPLSVIYKRMYHKSQDIFQ